jgi:hypothetical protein
MKGCGRVNIFSGIPAGDHYNSIQRAVEAITRRAGALRENGLLKPPWSLAELRLDKEDFAWLCDWMRQLPSGVAQRCLEDGQWRKFEIGSQRVSYTTVIGTLLLLAASEVARRMTDERSLWASISRSYFAETTRKLLFAQGYPSQAYKDAVEQSARWLELRHVFGKEGMQNWYDTIYLQFGFSRQGMMRRLSEWLAGWGETFSIQQLLQGQRMHSESFSSLWEMLRLFQRGNCTEAQLLAAVRVNPWILPEWTSELMQQARNRPRLSEGSIIAGEDVAEGAAPFLDVPLLRWDMSSPPHFTCSLTNLAQLDLEDETYEIVIAGRVCGRLYRKTDGSYRATPSDEIELPAMAPQLAASLIAANGQIVQNLTLQIWDQNEDVMAFHKNNGRRFDPWKSVMRPTSEVFLLLADDLTLDPPVQHWHVFKQQGVRLYYLPWGWSTLTRVLLGEQVLWQPYFTSPPVKSPGQVLTSQIQIFPDELSSPITFGEWVRLRIVLPTQMELVYIRTCGQLIAFEQIRANEVRTGEISITPRSFSFDESYHLDLLLGIKTGQDAIGHTTITRVHTFAELPISGAAILTASGWTALDPDTALEREQAGTQPVKVFLIEIETWDVLEGDIWVRHLSPRPHPLRALSGCGASLKLSRGVYNIYQEPRVLAREVVDHGSLAEVTIDAVEIGSRGNRESVMYEESAVRMLHIRLVCPIEPGEQHTIHWWDRTGAFHTLAPELSKAQDEGLWWQASVPPDLTEPIAIAIAYNGTRLGSWWDVRWSTAIRRPRHQDPETVAALLYWFHLPVLSPRYLFDVRSFAAVFPGEALAAWVGKIGLPPGLQWGELDDGWLSAVRTIFWNWRPTTIPVQQFIEPLLRTSAEQDILGTLTSVSWKLLRVSPLLIGLALQQWVSDEGIFRWGATQSRALVQHLIYNIAEAQSSDELQRNIATLEEDVARTMEVDPLFIERSLIQRAYDLLQDPSVALRRLDQDNLAIAMNVEPFRRLLGIKLFDRILQNIK